MTRRGAILMGVAVVAVVAGGVVHGQLTNRWGSSQALRQMQERFAAIPAVVGDWVSEDVGFDERELKMAGATSSLVRRYTNNATGDVVSIFMIAGLPSDIAAHTPDVCYPGAGFTLGPATLVELPGGATAGTVRTAEARREETDGTTAIRLHWCWDDGHGWAAPEDARGRFTGLPVLCKLYATSAGGNAAADESARALLVALLPQLHEAMFGGSAGAR
jgi:hypothetical protein